MIRLAAGLLVQRDSLRTENTRLRQEIADLKEELALSNECLDIANRQVRERDCRIAKLQLEKVHA